MNDGELGIYGYGLCEFGDVCSDCDQQTPKGELFFYDMHPEYPNEGEYWCRMCAESEIARTERDAEI